MQPTNTPPQSFEFKGQGGEYFKIWIVNVLLTIVTLGIYSAWAKVRTERYFYGNTFFDGSNFEYHATGWQIFKGRIIAAIVIVVLAIMQQVSTELSLIASLLISLSAPWMIWSSFRFRARVSSYRGVHFAFTGPFRTIMWNVLVLPFLPFLLLIGCTIGLYFVNQPTASIIFAGIAGLSLFLIIPFIKARMAEYHANGMNYGQGKFAAKLNVAIFYKAYLMILIVPVVFILLAFVIIPMLGISSLESLMNSGYQDIVLALGSTLVIALMAFILIGFFLYGFWAKAYLQERINNHIFNELTLDNAVSFSSTLKTKELLGLFVTNWLIVACTFGLGYPITKIRLAKYHAQSTAGTVNQDLDHYVSQQKQGLSAVGDELGQALDVQGDLGFNL
jgi:uncharacterized membrane protein YjgN (DUF898 family)